MHVHVIDLMIITHSKTWLTNTICLKMLINAIPPFVIIISSFQVIILKVWEI